MALRKVIFGRVKKKSANTFVGGVSATINTAALLAAKLGISTSRVTNFTIVGNDVKASVSGSYSLAQNFMYNMSGLTYFKDIDGLVISNATTLGSMFGSCFNLEEVYLPGMQTIYGVSSNWVFQNTYGTYTKWKTFYIPNVVNFGATAANDVNVFRNNFSNNIKIYAHPSMQTINAGGVEGDLALFDSLGTNSISYVQNTIKPSAVSNLSATPVINTYIYLNFTPVSNVNGISYYEVYANGVNVGSINGSGEIFKLPNMNTVYEISIVAVDIYFNRSNDSNKISITTPSTLSYPISYYKLNSDANDSIMGNNGIASNITYSTGKVGNSANFNGSTSKIDLGNLNLFKVTTGTISGWIKTSAAGSSYRGIIVKASAFGLFLKDNVLMTYDWGASSDRSTGINIANNTWRHVAMTFNSGVASGTKIYIDGVLQLTTTITILNQNTQLLIGSGTATTQFFSGAIDEASFSDYVLSDSQILDIYNKGVAGIELT